MNHLPFDRVRERVPLTDADYAAIRGNVMRKLERKERRVAPFVFRFAFAAMVVVAMFILRQTPPRSAAPHRIEPVATVPAQPPVLSGAPPTPAATATKVAAKPRKHRKPKRTEPETQIAIRMEIQTADPDVRIIWIAQ